MLWARRLGNRGSLVARFLKHLERRELAAIKRCDLTLCISDADRQWAVDRAPKARIDVLPVGLTLDRFERLSAEASVANQICFVGGLEWAPNEAGLQWFVNEVLPRIIAEAPTTRLAVLARGATERAWLVEHPHIDIMSGHSDAASLFASSRVSIAPLLDGGGVRVKILESLAAGCPAVATPIGGEGLALAGLTHCADPASFAEACLRRLQGSGLEARTSARRSVMEKHEARVVARQLVGFWTTSRRSIRDRTARLV
jgi:glycosyltransferase involved in cell wall biosynthesis